MKNIFALTLMILVISMTSCQNEASMNNNQNKIINASLSVDDFEKKLNENSKVQLIDVRTADEFNQAHLKNALNYDINSNQFETQIASLDKTKPVLVYCLSGGRSSSAAEIMTENGFKELYNMEGGMMKWAANKKPLDDGSDVPASDGLTVADFKALLETDKYVLVDYNAKWCQTCKKMAPMLESFSQNRKETLSLVKIDADKNKNLLQQKNIESLPVLELYKNGKLIWKHEGFIDEATLISETKL